MRILPITKSFNQQKVLVYLALLQKYPIVTTIIKDRTTMQEILRPTNQVIDNYLKEFKNNERYFIAEQATENLIEKFPNNSSIEDIILKISVLNDLYNTKIFGTFLVAQHILNLNIDPRIRDGDSTLVNEIAIGHSISKPNGGGDRNFYSFATNYCSLHNRESYPIYDSFIEKTLLSFQKADEFSSFSKKELKDFPKFKNIITDFKNFYGLTKHNFMEINKFMWMYEKQNSARNKSKS